MTEKLVNGDYVKSSEKSGLEKTEFIDEIVQSVILILTAHRGKFYPDKNYGSLLSDIICAPQDEYALCYARQALDSIDGVFVKKAQTVQDRYIFDLIINDEERQVEIKRESDL
ncbi:MAG: hypothetical protein ACI4IE_01945 [Eubacterium sp.]